MSTEISLDFPTFTNWISEASPGTAPDASDMQRIVNALQSLTAPPTVVATRYDSTLVNDGAFHPCRFDRVRWDWSPDGAHFCPELAAGATFTSTFVLPWSGFYLVEAVERWSVPGSTTGYVNLQLLLDSGICIDQDPQPVSVGVQQQCRISRRWRFDAGTSLSFQHAAITNNPVTLYTDNPVPFAAISWLGRNFI